MRLLIVDDSNMIRLRIAHIALQAHLQDLDVVGLFRDGAEVLTACAKTHPDVATLDLTMPTMDGVT